MRIKLLEAHIRHFRLLITNIHPSKQYYPAIIEMSFLIRNCGSRIWWHATETADCSHGGDAAPWRWSMGDTRRNYRVAIEE